MAQPTKIPAFFKFFNPEVSSPRLNVPLSFTFDLKGMLPDKVFLKNRHGNLWPVLVLKTGHDLFFADGWVKFIEDNDVTLGDFLVFQFDGSNVFDFKLLGTTACEKNSTAKVTEENEKNEKRRGEDDEEEEGTWRPMEEEEEETNDDDEYDIKDYHESDEEEDVDDDDNVDMAVVEEKSKSYRAGVKKLSKRTSAGASGSKGAWNKVVDISESGLIPLPANPLFIAHLRPRKRNELMSDYPCKKGKQFVSRTANWTDGRKVLTDGYRAFCMANKVRKKDKLLCEFLSHQELLIRVLHFQA